MEVHQLRGMRAMFLEDGGQQAPEVAAQVAAFIQEAERTLDVAIYDFEAREGAPTAIGDALEAASARGVEIRVVFNMERCDNPADSRPMQAHAHEIDGLEVPTRGIHDTGNLMHHKYVVRDGSSVWTGSTNWTNDSFSREENVLIALEDLPSLAADYTANFEDMWAREKVERTGAVGREVASGGDGKLRPYFAPFPPFLGHMVAGRIVEADRRLKVVSPVITSGAVLGTLCEHIARRSLDVGGAYDATQMLQVQREWDRVPHNRWKIAAWRTIEPYLSGKVSTPYRPDSVHDYMHAKFVVIDHEVVTGSYNLSKHGEINAENVLHIVDNDVADRFDAFADRVAARYAEASDASGGGAVGDDQLPGRPDTTRRDLEVVSDEPTKGV
jgi:phosphatidylserine/phosphatidylglycerophosphate/cardiolipin synthase-like enzyme